MRIARVTGVVTLGRSLPELKSGRFVLAEVLDSRALAGLASGAKRDKPMPESLVVFDQLGAGVGQVIAVSEGAEAAAPFYPDKVPIDAYSAAILDNIEFSSERLTR